MEHNYYRINEIQIPFKYVLSTSPIDNFEFTLSKEQLIENIKYLSRDNDYSDYLNGFENVNELEKYIIDYVTNICKAEPYLIRYVGIPNPYNNDFELVVIAKISDDGICFIFSNNEAYLKSINRLDSICLHE